MTDTTTSILVVDDDPTQRQLLTGMIKRAGYAVETADDGDKAIARVANSKPDVSPVGCMILDLQMPTISGIDVLKALQPEYPHLPIIVLTAHSSVNRIVEAMRAGASDFIVKPASAERIRMAIESALSHVSMTGELAPVLATQEKHPGFEDLIGKSIALSETVRLAKKAATSSIPVLIEGPSGVGKEMFARAIHRAGARAEKPFIAVNCGAIPENLVESILFGHEKGAFTGAVEKHIGKFQEASGGTLFLDEVGELSLDIQVKLLRALQEGEIDPVGATKPITVDIRLISATNRNMAALVEQGNIREDLYYRLNVFPLHIPPLKNRSEDIPVLAQHFADMVTKSEGLQNKTFSDDALDLLCGYYWPGNIRQLQNAIFRAVVMSETDELQVEDFPQILSPGGGLNGQSYGSATVISSRTLIPSPESGAFFHHVNLLNNKGDLRPLSDIEEEAIRKAIRLCEGRLAEVARRLGIGRSTLYRRLEDLDLLDEAQRARAS